MFSFRAFPICILEQTSLHWLFQILYSVARRGGEGFNTYISNQSHLKRGVSFKIIHVFSRCNHSQIISFKDGHRNKRNDLLMETGSSISGPRSCDVTVRMGVGKWDDRKRRYPWIGPTHRKYVRTFRHNENRYGKCRKYAFPNRNVSLIFISCLMSHTG